MLPVLRGAFAAVVLACLTSGCAWLTRPEVGVRDARPGEIAAKMETSALAPGEVSMVTRELLHAFDLSDTFDDDPEKALRALHDAAVREPTRDLFFALADVSFSIAVERKDREHYLAAAIYAYYFLLGHDDNRPPNPFDRRFRWACEFYNRGLLHALSDDQRSVHIDAGERALPFGRAVLSIDRSTLPASEPDAAEYLAADAFEVFGLSLRYRRSGLGVPLIAVLTPEAFKAQGSTDAGQRPPGLPETVFLRVDGQLGDFEHGVAATLELHVGDERAQTLIDGKPVPLESDLTAPLAWSLGRSKLWEFNLTGLFGENSEVASESLVAIEPFATHRVPVVFVHGTASNPAYWAEMFNTLRADPILSERTQCWFFIYESGNPIALSAAALRDALTKRLHELDPDGQDEALKHVVVVGHSQGGLLARMLVTDGDLGWVQELTGKTLEELKLPAHQEELVRHAIDFDPVPQVDRVVFISTPHRGSYMAATWFTRLLSSFILPRSDVRALDASLAKSKDPTGGVLRVRTSLENMDPGNRFLQLLARAPIAQGVAVHSIIPVKGDGPIEKGSDGIVKYKSAHLDEAESEFVIRYGHSCQQQPSVVREVRRILLEELDAIDARKH